MARSKTQMSSDSEQVSIQKKHKKNNPLQPLLKIGALLLSLEIIGVALDHRGRTKKGCLCLKDLKAIVQFVWQQLQSEILLGAFNSGSNHTQLYSKPSAFGASDPAPGCVRINRRLIV